jgi:hypothetical protein
MHHGQSSMQNSGIARLRAAENLFVRPGRIASD